MQKILAATVSEISLDLERLSEFVGTSKDESLKIIEKAYIAGECDRNPDSIRQWIDDRFIPNTIFIDHHSYSAMCIAALRTAQSTVATDYGSSRQRDLGQIWSDKTRGYLGECAFKIFLAEKFGIQITLGHEEGSIEEFLGSDVRGVISPEGERPPGFNIGIKQVKMNGMWFDIPNAQFHHSDMHVCVKVGVPTDHLFSFFKSISVFRDKVLKLGIDNNFISGEESTRIYDAIPSMSKIPAYVTGFVRSGDSFLDLPYAGRRTPSKFFVTSWKGQVKSGDLARIASTEGIININKIEFEQIQKFSHDNGYLFNTGSLLWERGEWNNQLALI